MDSISAFNAATRFRWRWGLFCIRRTCRRRSGFWHFIWCVKISVEPLVVELAPVAGCFRQGTHRAIREVVLIVLVYIRDGVVGSIIAANHIRSRFAKWKLLCCPYCPLQCRTGGTVQRSMSWPQCKSAVDCLRILAVNHQKGYKYGVISDKKVDKCILFVCNVSCWI